MKYSTDYKKSAIDYYKKVRNYVLVCKIFGCSRSSLIRWINQDKLNNNFFNKITIYVIQKTNKSE